MKALVLAAVVLFAGCGARPIPVTDAGEPFDAGASFDAGKPVVDAGTPDAGAPDAGKPAVDAGQPPRRWPPLVQPVTHDVDVGLAAVLETQTIAGACEALDAGATDDATVLRCGKWMFFYETFGTVGVPVGLLEFAQKHYADTFYGPGFSQLGFVPDPANAKGMPIGLAPTTGKLGSITTRAFTCAACHFGQLSDGRFAVGYGNGKLDYGTFLASLGAPLSLSFNENDPKVAPELRMRLASAVAAAKLKSGYTTEAGLLGLSLLGAGNTGSSTVEEQQRFLALKPGTMDFLTKPLIDDGVWTVSRIVSLWNLPDEAQRQAAHMPHEMLSLNGGVKRTMDFLKGFVAIGIGTTWTEQRLLPLERYLRSLRAPEPSMPPGDTETGAALFVEKGCLGCHAGPSGEGTRVFTFAEMGTDDAYANIYNPTDAGAPCCGLGNDPSTVTRGVKAARLAGVFTARRLLHNGSIASLEELFCLTPRDASTLVAQTSKGHTMTCDGLDPGEKQALLRYLRSL